MANIIITEKQIGILSKKLLEKKESNKETINESLISAENFLMAAGFIPVIGEIADIALIIYYLTKGEKLYAALMLIALIPTVGDFIVKPIIKLFKGSSAGVVAMKKGGTELAEYLAKNPQIASKFSSLKNYVNTPAVTKTVEGISKVNSGLGSKLKQGLKEISSGGMMSGLKAGGKEVIQGGKFKTGLKNYYQGQRLSKYFAEKGVLPETGIKRWWQNIGARQDRKNDFRRFIAANNLLNYFGIPSLTTFEQKMSDDPEFREKIADDPKTSDYIAQNYNSEEMTNSSIEGGQTNPQPTNMDYDPIQNMFKTLFGGLS